MTTCAVHSTCSFQAFLQDFASWLWCNRLENEIEHLQQQRDSINRQRKLSQESDGRAIQQMEQQYKSLVAKNMEINMACQELESEVNQLQEEVGQSDAFSHDT